MDKLKFIELALLSAFSVCVYHELISIFLIKKIDAGRSALFRYIPWAVYFVYNLSALYIFWSGFSVMPIYLLGALICYCLICFIFYNTKSKGYVLFINIVYSVSWMSIIIILKYIFWGIGIVYQNEVQFQLWYLGCVLSQVVMLAIIKLVGLKARKKGEFFISKRHFGICFGTTICTAFIANTVYYLRPETSNTPALVMCVVSILLMIGMNMMSYTNFQNYSESLNVEKNNLIYQRQVNDYMFQCQSQEAMIKQVNEINHDIKNHLITIRELAKNSETSRLYDYIDNLLDSGVSTRRELVKTGNYVVDALINEKYSRAVNAGTDFKVDAFVPKNLPFADEDLALILGNALDNAIEAVEATSEKQITVSLVYSKMVFKIEICNTYDGEIFLGSKKEIRTKKKQAKLHGVGIPAIEHAVEKYDGELSIEYDDKWFKLVAILYAPEE